MAKYDTDIRNMEFGLLTARKRLDKFTWLCECSCGNIIEVNIYHLLNGHTKSCGCTRVENFKFNTHNMSKTRLYQCYHSMLKRCKTNEDYIKKNIEVCKEWADNFLVFEEWAVKNGYKDNLTLERKDVYGDYCPTNCCWIEKNRQSDNRSNTIYLDYNGTIHSLVEWAQILGMTRIELYRMYKKGLDIKQIIKEKGKNL